MRLSTVLFAAIGITRSLASTSPNENNNDIEISNNNDIDTNNNQERAIRNCPRSASSLLRSTPTPTPSEFRSWLSSTYLPSSPLRPTTTITDGPNALGCAPTDIPSSLSSDFEEYRTSLLQSWYTRKSSSISRLLGRCSPQSYTAVRKVQTLAAMVTGQCGLVTAGPTRTTTSTRRTTTTTNGGAAPTGNGNGVGGATTSTSRGGAARAGFPMATGLGSVGGAVVVGAVVGAMGVVGF